MNYGNLPINYIADYSYLSLHLNNLFLLEQSKFSRIWTPKSSKLWNGELVELMGTICEYHILTHEIIYDAQQCPCWVENGDFWPLYTVIMHGQELFFG